MTMCVTSKRHRIDDQDAGAYYFLVKREKTHKSDNESEVCSLEEGHRAVTSPTPPPFAVIARGFPLIIGTMTIAFDHWHNDNAIRCVLRNKSKHGQASIGEKMNAELICSESYPKWWQMRPLAWRSQELVSPNGPD